LRTVDLGVLIAECNRGSLINTEETEESPSGWRRAERGIYCGKRYPRVISGLGRTN
jgi:hypothetical protein